MANMRITMSPKRIPTFTTSCMAIRIHIEPPTFSVLRRHRGETWGASPRGTDRFILGALLGSDVAFMRARHLAFVLLAAMVMASIPLWAAPGPEVRGQVNLTITMRDSLSFNPASFSAAPGESVSLTLVNAGALDHTFTLFGQANANVPVSSDFSATQDYYNANSKLVDMSFGGGEQDSASFTAPMTEGTYTFVCMIAGHPAGGMHGTMTVTSASPDDPAPIDPLLIGIVVAVVVIVIAVAGVFILRRRK